MTFDQFVNLFSVFSDRAPREMKVQFAFKIFGNQEKKLLFSFSKWHLIIVKLNFSDFDGDGFLSPSDIENAVKSLTQNELNHDEIESIWQKVNYDNGPRK